MMTPSRFEKYHPKLLWVGVLMAAAVLVTACGGGDSSTNVTVLPNTAGTPATSPPTTTTTTTTSTAPLGEIATLADVAACPASEYTASTTWHVACLAGKRLVGNTVTGEACELRLQANGVFEYVKNGVITSTTQPIAKWLNTSGTYINLLADGYRFFEGRLDGRVFNPVTNMNEYHGIFVKIQDDTWFPDDASFNDDTVEFTLVDGKKETCKLNKI
jgi:hypothetical protein